MKTFVIGDIHGTYKALLQCLERSKFEFGVDQLITLGDIVDGFQDSIECIHLLSEIRNRIDIVGNHDVWCRDWIRYCNVSDEWKNNGGEHTIKTFIDKDAQNDPVIERFFNGQHNYYVDDKNRLFIHGGYQDHRGAGFGCEETYTWDRRLWMNACSGHTAQSTPKILKPYSEIFLGHTSTQKWKTDRPMNRCNVWNIDTGAGYTGKLTIMNVDTKEFWQSDLVDELGYHTNMY